MRIVVSTFVALSISASLHAQSNRDPVSTDFYFSRTDLANQSGAERVLDEIELEVSEVCRTLRPDSTLKGQVDKDCFDGMVAYAVDEIDSKNLTAVYLKQKNESLKLNTRN